MHRLLKLRGLSLQQIHVVSKSTLVNNPIRLRDRPCDLCKQTLVPSIRYQSTHTNPVIQVSTKRRRTKKPKSYAEILEVTGQSHTEARASVKKLKAKDLSLLAQEPEIGLGELHKIKARSRFINNNPADPTLTTVDVEEIVEQLEISQDPAAEHEEHIDINEDPTAQNDPNLKTGKQRERAGKEEALIRTLGAHVEMCVAIGNPQRGLTSMIYYRNRAEKNNSTAVKSINIYNTLLQGFAAKGNINKIKEILKLMREDDLKLNIQSFAAILECLGRVYNNSNRTKVIRYYFTMMSNHGISFDDIMNKAEFVSDQRETILSVIRRIHPDYIPTYKPPDVQYTCDMLESLNSKDQLVPVDNDLPGSELNERLCSSAQLKVLTKQQLEIEMDGYVKVRSIESKPKPSQQVLQFRELLNKVMTDWEEVALKAFKRDLDILIAQPRQGSKTLALDPYLRCLPITDYIQVIINEVRRLAEGSETYSPTTNQLYRELGSRVYARYLVQRKLRDGVLRKVCGIQEAYCDWVAEHHGRGSAINTRQQWQWLAHERQDGATVNGVYHHSWPATTMIAVGEFLYKIIMHDFKIDVNIIRANNSKEKLLPAFYTLFRSQGRVVKEEVKPHPVLARLFRGSEQPHLVFPAYEVPMRCPPRPWTSVTSGGYLVAHADVVRLPVQAVQQWQRLNRAPEQSLYPALDSLNQLASVPWTVNKEVLGVILEVFNSGGSSRLDVPQPPSACPPAPIVTSTMTKAEKFMAFKQRMQVRRRKAEMYSLWCDALYRLSLANHFKDDVFWLPHNMDFRGRVYPVPPHLNHLGSDLARSMLVFAERRPLGPKGLDWLKIHCINLTGLKKRDRIEDRLQYANEIMPEILDSADNPLTGNMWWAQSDEPWQTLACCMEIARASRAPDPATYKSRFPVHQDGSCNGLQHYAALGRDSAGAYSVNLAPAAVPQDVYSAVATLVEEQRVKDAKAGVKVAQVLDGFVRRKVIKQTVMTTVYGVTRFGARLQIARQLKDIEDFPKDMVWAASTYLTSKTFESLRSMFTSTREIQDWFTECARLISAVNGQNVEWVTPLGLPVVQPYSRHRKIEHGKKMVPENFNMDMFERPNVMKQKNAFPPNFIHSLDSSHMMLTSLFCERAGITFVSVHDCFWTHPCSVHIMNEICREQFVALHSQPILEDLSKFLVKKYSYKNRDFTDDGSVVDLTRRKLNKVLQKIPPKGDFDLNSVLNSIYFFS